ncbi:MAG: type II toxin-antitoxin system VapC family toxin [Methylococcaceae bacterium]
MYITIDTSALIAVIANEPHKNKIIKLTEGVNLCTPTSVHWEIGNAFSAMLKRNRIDIVQAQSCLHAYRVIPLKFVEVNLEQSLELVDRLKIYAYDAYLIQCAKQSKSALLTLDNGLCQAAKSVGIT